jgi:hypothetical protein
MKKRYKSNIIKPSKALETSTTRLEDEHGSNKVQR